MGGQVLAGENLGTLKPTPQKYMVALDPDFCLSSVPKFLVVWPGPQLSLHLCTSVSPCIAVHWASIRGDVLGLDSMAGGPRPVPKSSFLPVSLWRGQVAEDSPRGFAFCIYSKERLSVSLDSG